MFICLFLLPSSLSFHHSSLHPPPGRPGWPLVKSGHPSLSEITTRVESNYPPTSELFVSFRWRPMPRHHRDISPPSASSTSAVGCAALLEEGAWFALGFDYSEMLLRGGEKKKRCWEWLIHGGARISFLVCNHTMLPLGR